MYHTGAEYDGGGGVCMWWGQAVFENAIPSARFFCKPKIVYFENQEEDKAV